MSDFLEEKEVPDGWAVRTYQDAEWSMQMIALAQRRIDQRKAYAEEMHRRIDERLEAITKTDRGSIDFFSGELMPWVQAEIKDQKAKSTKLAFGTAGYRKGGGKLIVEDEEKAVEYLEANGHAEAVKTTKTVLKTEAIKVGKFPGTRIEPKHDNFYVKPDYSLFLDDK